MASRMSKMSFSRNAKIHDPSPPSLSPSGHTLPPCTCIHSKDVPARELVVLCEYNMAVLTRENLHVADVLPCLRMSRTNCCRKRDTVSRLAALEIWKDKHLWLHIPSSMIRMDGTCQLCWIWISRNGALGGPVRSVSENGSWSNW